MKSRRDFFYFHHKCKSPQKKHKGALLMAVKSVTKDIKAVQRLFSLDLADIAHLQFWEVVTHRTVSPKLWKDNIEGLLHLKIGQLLVPKSTEGADQAFIWSAAM